MFKVRRTAVLVLALAAGALAGQQPKTDAKAEKLRQADKAAMADFRAGKKVDGGKKLLEAIEPYKDLSPKDCTKEESLALAVVYVRIVSVAGKQLSDETLMAYIGAIRGHSRKGGIAADEYDTWFKTQVKETVAALNEKK